MAIELLNALLETGQHMRAMLRYGELGHSDGNLYWVAGAIDRLELVPDQALFDFCQHLLRTDRIVARLLNGFSRSDRFLQLGKAGCRLDIWKADFLETHSQGRMTQALHNEAEVMLSRGNVGVQPRSAGYRSDHD